MADKVLSYPHFGHGHRLAPLSASQPARTNRAHARQAHPARRDPAGRRAAGRLDNDGEPDGAARSNQGTGGEGAGRSQAQDWHARHAAGCVEPARSRRDGVGARREAPAGVPAQADGGTRGDRAARRGARGRARGRGSHRAARGRVRRHGGGGQPPTAATTTRSTKPTCGFTSRSFARPATSCSSR